MRWWSHLKADLPAGLRRDESGMALIYVTMMLPVIIGFSLLAVDVSRVSVLQSSLQHGADAIALAMAAELDRGSDAITRADRARDNLISNPALFTDSYSSVDKDTIDRVFLSALPASDADPITSTYETTNPALARFVKVTVHAAVYDTIFPASFINAVNSVSADATAVAGMDPGACNVVPMFICNPLEPSTNTDPYRITELLAHVSSPSDRRRLFELKAFANTQSQFSPGNFGYLDVNLGKGGARGLNEAISQAVPGSCVTLNGMKTKAGNTAVTNDAFNVRFDMYGGNFKKDDAAIRPSRNTRKSWVPAKSGNNVECSPSEVTDLYTGGYSLTKLPPAMGFPRDSCMVSGTCGAGFGGRRGNGDWNGMFDLYMTTNFGTNKEVWPKKSDGSAFAASDLPSRYDVYRAEIAQDKVKNTGSMADPKCYNNTATVPNDMPDRRLIFAAIANCTAAPIGSGSTTINAAAFGQFFLTEPVSSQGSVYAELVNILKPGSGSGTNGALVTDNVQLYR